MLAAVLCLSVGLIGCGGGVANYDLTIMSSEGGSTMPTAGTHSYAPGTEVDLVATPDADYQFANWTGVVETIANVSAAATIIVMNDDYSIKANFIKQYDITISSTTGGSVTIPGEGLHTYDKGDVVNLVAKGEEGYRFVEWTGDIDTIADASGALTTIVMNGDYVITANFEELEAEELFAGGNGTQVEPYRIANWHHLNNVRYSLSAHYMLMNDLDSDTTGYAGLASTSANDGMGWEPIGDFENLQLAFTGGFDGMGHQVRDLFIDRPDEMNTGLFDAILSEAVVENIGIVNGSVTGGSNVGNLAGVNTGNISCSYADGVVTGVLAVGGLLGGNDGSVSSSYIVSNVNGYIYVGGLVGVNYRGTVSSCHSTGSVIGSTSVGGLVGDNWAGTVNDSYSTGNVTGYSQIGGLVGKNEDTVSNSFWDAQTSGQATSDGGTGKTTAEMKSIATFSGAGWNITAVAPGERNTTYTWNIVDGQTYPFLSWQPVS